MGQSDGLKPDPQVASLIVGRPLGCQYSLRSKAHRLKPDPQVTSLIVGRPLGRQCSLRSNAHRLKPASLIVGRPLGRQCWLVPMLRVGMQGLPDMTITQTQSKSFLAQCSHSWRVGIYRGHCRIL